MLFLIKRIKGGTLTWEGGSRIRKGSRCNHLYIYIYHVISYHLISSHIMMSVRVIMLSRVMMSLYVIISSHVTMSLYVIISPRVIMPSHATKSSQVVKSLHVIVMMSAHVIRSFRLSFNVFSTSSEPGLIVIKHIHPRVQLHVVSSSHVMMSLHSSVHHMS